jgi:hypothetical protein
MFYLGIRNVKKRFKGTSLEYAYLPYSKGGKMKLLEDVNGMPLFKTTLNNIPFTNTPSQNVYMPTQNIKDQDFNMSFKKDNGDIFSTKPLGEASYSSNRIAYMFQCPMEFYDDRTGKWTTTK